MKISKMILVSATTALLGISAISCTSTKENANNSSYGSEGKNNGGGELTLNTIYFDFDRSNIRADQQPNVAAMANSMNRYLKNHPNAKFQIQGNTDDRGSVEYNMALGTRRANALQRDLVMTYGINSDNLDTVSYGKERPAVQGNEEVIWSQNRRDDVALLGE